MATNALHLADQVGAGGARVSGQEQQQGGQQHRVQDEEQVVHKNPDEDQIPGPLPDPASAASVPETGARRVHNEEDKAQEDIHPPRKPPKGRQGVVNKLFSGLIRIFFHMK